MRAETMIDAVGAAMDHAHALIIDAERIGANLRDHGLYPLPDRRRPGDYFDASRDIDCDSDAAYRTAPAMLEEHHGTHSDRFTRRLAAFEIRLELMPPDLRA